ncbi:uncharacterized protein K441DRAFT_556078 [Cenococcum geophilum 1.58]|uniref:uncharacterized protein n=1 Tax=Cenococcum geophilum 1.58 TaxID=794803 RepID=UPI00358F5C17|nr:hypothetical protein K441DRAFT_556078 [Cenococcum geophilum 1.58]
MRYEYWDVILFPAESHIPIQEFRTACYVSQAQDGRRLPILTCFVRSLSPLSPFRISVHSWTKPTPSSYVESKRKPEQRVVYTIRVIIDGFRILHNYFEKNTSWPQQIRTKPTFGFLDSAIRGSSLLFPAFNPSVLSQSSWDAQESNGRIKVIVAEELISESTSGIAKSGATNDLICFSFQHAPKGMAPPSPPSPFPHQPSTNTPTH